MSALSPTIPHPALGERQKQAVFVSGQHAYHPVSSSSLSFFFLFFLLSS